MRPSREDRIALALVVLLLALGYAGQMRIHDAQVDSCERGNTLRANQRWVLNHHPDPPESRVRAAQEVDCEAVTPGGVWPF